MFFRICCIWLLLAGFTGCLSNPPTSVHQPMSAKPVERRVIPPADGAIYHAGINERFLFEDRRARNIGDILTINIVEKTTGNSKSSGTSSSSNSVAGVSPQVSTPAYTMLKAITVTGSSSNKSSMSGAGAASEDMTGSITVTVIEVLANGNLLVSGEKQVSLNKSDEFIRFSGVVNPTNITNLNVVQSTQVADAHIEYKNAGPMNEVMNDIQSLGFLGRFFLSVLPF